MSVGELNTMVTCKKHLQVRPNIGGLSAVPAGHGSLVVKHSLTTDFGALLRQAAGRERNATGLRELEALEERIKNEGDK
jgi:hypothetical protein